MRRILAAATVFSCLCAALGCRHVSGVCDCAPTPGLNYWGCPGYGGCSTPAATPVAQPEQIKAMPKVETPKE